MTTDIAVQGTVATGLEAVRDAFEANFRRPVDDCEVGASICVYVGGRQVVDLWGGFSDAAKSRPWQNNTLVNIWSATKGVGRDGSRHSRRPRKIVVRCACS